MQPLIQKLQERLQLLEQVQSDDQRLWGVMSPQNVIEHLGGVFYGTAQGKKGKVLLPPEAVVKFKTQFFSSYYPFPKNVKMPGTQDQPTEAPPLRYETIEEARGKLNSAVLFYLKRLQEQPTQTTTHGYFGDLTMEEWLPFHIKHVEHHLMQYDVLPRDEKIPELEKLLYKIEKHLQTDTPAQWGKMDAHHMVEHLGVVFSLSTWKDFFPYKGTEEDAKRYWEGFSKSENPWKEVFPVVESAEPKPTRKANLAGAKVHLKKSFQKYLAYCEANPDAVNPQFYLGNLTVDQWRQVHVKHLKHHMRQFGMEV